MSHGLNHAIYLFLRIYNMGHETLTCSLEHRRAIFATLNMEGKSHREAGHRLRPAWPVPPLPLLIGGHVSPWKWSGPLLASGPVSHVSSLCSPEQVNKQVLLKRSGRAILRKDSVGRI